MNTTPHLARRLCLMLAVIVGGCINALAANGFETLAEVRTICSKRPLGRSIFWECSSTVAYLDAATSEVYYCNGDHLVITEDAAVRSISLKAECKPEFQPFPGGGTQALLDLTQDQSPALPTSKRLYPEGVAWVASTQSRAIQYCSKFLAGIAGMQDKCVAATFQ